MSLAVCAFDAGADNPSPINIPSTALNVIRSFMVFSLRQGINPHSYVAILLPCAAGDKSSRANNTLVCNFHRCYLRAPTRSVAKLYRSVLHGKLNPGIGRARIWMLERSGLRLEAIALEKFHDKLDALAAVAEGHERGHRQAVGASN
jgi:hypothetical protein